MSKIESIQTAETKLQSKCPECGSPVIRKAKTGRTPIFCCPEHAQAFHRREAKEGAAVISYLKAWRVNRGSGLIAKAALAQMCQIVDGFNAENKMAGRPRPDYYAAKLMQDGRLYMDRRHGKNHRYSRDEHSAEQPDPLLDILRQIAEGHNDPRALAAITLGIDENTDK